MTDEQAAQLKALTNITHYEHSPDSRVLLLAVIEWLNLDEGSPEKWRGLETILFKALSRHRKATSMTNEQAARNMYENWMAVHAQRFHVGGDIESFIEALSAALAARERAIWLEAAQELENCILVAGASGTNKIDVPGFIAWCRQQAERVKL